MAVLLLLALALWRGWASAVAWTLALVAALYATGLAAAEGEAVLDSAAPLFAAGLLVVGELAYWSLDLRLPGHDERDLMTRRLTALVALAFVSVALAALVVVVSAFPLGGGVGWRVVGVAAAAATLAIVARLARQGAARRDASG